jgi:hypothetical protein
LRPAALEAIHHVARKIPLIHRLFLGWTAALCFVSRKHEGLAPGGGGSGFNARCARQGLVDCYGVHHTFGSGSFRLVDIPETGVAGPSRTPESDFRREATTQYLAEWNLDHLIAGCAATALGGRACWSPNRSIRTSAPGSATPRGWTKGPGNFCHDQQFEMGRLLDTGSCGREPAFLLRGLSSMRHSPPERANGSGRIGGMDGGGGLM